MKTSAPPDVRLCGDFQREVGITARSALITRKQLNPYEEAKAVAAMLERGLTEDGAAQALGWSKIRVTARVKILELPERAQQLVGAGVIALGAVDQLRAIGAVAPELLEAVIAYLDDGNEWAAERLAREPGWVLDSAMNHGDSKAFAAYLHSVGAHEISDLRLGKKTEALYAEAEKLHRQLDRYAYGPPAIRFTEADVDQARAAGVLIEFDRGRPIIVDRSLYRELVKGAVKRTTEELRAKVTAAAQDKTAQRTAKAPADPFTVAKRDRDTQLRELADQAHGANLDLGVSLLNGLAAVDPADMDVARVFALCRRRHRANYADRLTMRISRCRTRGTATRLVVSLPKHTAVALVARTRSRERLARGRPALASTRARRRVAIATSPCSAPSPGRITGRGLRATSLSRCPETAPVAGMSSVRASAYGTARERRDGRLDRAHRGGRCRLSLRFGASGACETATITPAADRLRGCGRGPRRDDSCRPTRLLWRRLPGVRQPYRG